MDSGYNSFDIVKGLVTPCDSTGECPPSKRKACISVGTECKAFRQFCNNKHGRFDKNNVGHEVRIPPCRYCERRYFGCEDSCAELRRFYHHGTQKRLTPRGN